MPFKVNVTDRWGFHHAIDLSRVPFVIQQKATPTRQVITELLNNGQVELVKQHLRLIVDMYLDEYRRGIWDRDHNYMYNTGFVDGLPIRIDVGRLRYNENMKDPAYAARDLQKVAVQRTSEWLNRHFPQYREEIVADMNRKVNEFHAQ